MKKLLSIICLTLTFISLKSQNKELDKFPVEVSKENFTAHEVSYMVVAPGCKRIDHNNKKDLQTCFAQVLNNLLETRFGSFIDKMDKEGLTSAIAKVQFIIDKNGKIIDVKAMSGGNAELGIEVVKAMNTIAEKMGKIQPATLVDGTPVNLFFQLPVKIELSDSKISEFRWNEVVIATLIGNNEKFEVRENKKDSNVKVYEIKNGKELFLGNFSTFTDVIKHEPYKSIFTSSDRLLLAEKEVNKIVYRIYYSQTNDNFIDAYKIVGDKEVLIESLSQSRIEFSSLYLKLILR